MAVLMVENLRINKGLLKGWAVEEECLNEAGTDRHPFQVVEIVDLGRTRWESHHRLIVRQRDTGLFWAADFSRGLTEGQDSSWFDLSAGSDGLVEMFRVQPHDVVVREWRVVPKTGLTPPQN